MHPDGAAMAGLVTAAPAAASRGDQPASSPRAATPAWVRLPQRFPSQFPPPPNGSLWLSTQVAQRLLPAAGPIAEIGVLEVTMVYRHPGSDPAAVRHLVDHYHTTLAGAGWPVTDRFGHTDPRGGVRPEHRLHVADHRHHLTVTIRPGQATVTTRIVMTEIDREPAPSIHLEEVSPPSWYLALPDPPRGHRQQAIHIAVNHGEPTSHVLRYRDHRPAHQRADAADLAAHYRVALPANGWTIRAQQAHTEQPPSLRGAIKYHHQTIVFAGIDGQRATGALRATATTTASGQRLGTALAISVDSVDTSGQQS